MSSTERLVYETEMEETPKILKKDKPSVRAISVFKKKPFAAPVIKMLDVK